MTPSNLRKKIWQDPTYFIAFGFGSGLSPIAPGTFGTLAAVPVYLLLANVHWSMYLILTIVAFFIGVWVSEKVTRELGVHDYKGIVWDEIVGYLVTMFLVPSGLLWMVLGFILFRIFDIWKPQPIRLIDEKFLGGGGIMLDDLLAGIFAWLTLHILVWSFHVK